MLSLITALALGATAGAPAQPADSLSLLSELALPATLAPQEEAGKAASPFSYTFFEIGATKYNIDEIEVNGESFDDEVDTYYGRASLGLFDFLYVFGAYENQSFDYEAGDTDADTFRLGAGAHLGVTEKLDLLGDIAWVYSDMSSDASEWDDTTDGFEVHLGGRWMPIGWDGGGVELHGGGIYVDMENRLASDDEAFGWDAGAKLHFLKLFSVGAVYTMLEDDDSATINARVSF